MEDVSPECCRRSFGASIMDTAKRLLEDPTIAPRSTHSERMEICQKCDKFEEDKQTCQVCGCFLPLKTTFANVKCPLDKWNEWKRNTDITSNLDI